MSTEEQPSCACGETTGGARPVSGATGCLRDEHGQPIPLDPAHVIEDRFFHDDVPPHAVGVVTIPGEMPLTSGECIADVHVAYETWGSLDETGSNAVLVCHALTGDSHVASGEDQPPAGLPKPTGVAPKASNAHGGEADADGEAYGSPGWWSGLIGPGKAIDTHKYFVICTNVLGGCSGTTGPLSPNPERTQSTIDPAGPDDRYGPDFPFINVEDMVEVEFRARDQLGIKHLLAVVGGSLGGMQTLVWAREHPDRVSACMAVATTWHSTPQNIAFDEVGRRAIMHDPRFSDGRYRDEEPPANGLAIARMVGHITYLSDESMDYKFGRRLVGDEREYTFHKEFQVESYLEHQGYKFVDRFDANSYLYLTRAIDYYALGPSLEAVTEEYRDTKVRFLMLSFSSDWLYPTSQLHELAEALSRAQAEVSFAEIEAPNGHDAFLLETKRQSRYAKGFLDANYERDLAQGVGAATPYARRRTKTPDDQDAPDAPAVRGGGADA